MKHEIPLIAFNI